MIVSFSRLSLSFVLSCVASSWASWHIVAHISVSSCLCDIFFATSSSSARSLSVSSRMMDPKSLISSDTRLRDALCRMSLHFRSLVVFERYIWGSIQGFMFLGGWFRVRHVSIKVLWWLALASAMRVAFRFLPSSCRLCC